MPSTSTFTRLYVETHSQSVEALPASRDLMKWPYFEVGASPAASLLLAMQSAEFTPLLNLPVYMTYQYRLLSFLFLRPTSPSRNIVIASIARRCRP
jgi:hypothetical protein